MENQNIVHLNKNENLYGPSSECYEVLKDVSINDFIYYSRESVGAIEKEISARFKIPSDQIILGYGAEDIIKTLFTHYISHDDKVLIPDKSWWYYKSLVEQRDAKPIIYPLDERENEFITSVDTLLRFEDEIKPKFTLVCSPNNPTGNSIDIIRFEEILKKNKDRIVCLDETYWGYSKKDTTETVINYLKKYDNLVVIRSFSKYYALAGIRIGYAFCGAKAKKVMKFYDKILGFNKISENLAIAALKSDTYYKKITKAIVDDRENLYREINNIPGVTAYKSEANFILVKIPNELKESIDKALKAKGYHIKLFTEDSFSDCARISLGTTEHNQVILKTIKERVLAQSAV
ncbi:MAG: histidinol-phosphate aminotransferase family protein [Spirochaetota bacterium]|nr:histidinol-phosphate aminotransferase family protein [Spirochaetota bacterium]